MNSNILRANILREEPVNYVFRKETEAKPRHQVDPRSKDFVHVLMQCFNTGRRVAIEEAEQLSAAKTQASQPGHS